MRRTGCRKSLGCTWDIAVYVLLIGAMSCGILTNSDVTHIYKQQVTYLTLACSFTSCMCPMGTSSLYLYQVRISVDTGPFLTEVFVVYHSFFANLTRILEASVV